MNESTVSRLMCVALACMMVIGAIIGCGARSSFSEGRKNIENYDAIIDSLPDDTYYAFANIGSTHDALLVATKDYVYDNGDKTWATTEADVYGFDADGNIREYGKVEGGGTATPLACKNGELYVGGHNYMNKVSIDEASSELVTVDGEFFDDYQNAAVVRFTQMH